jgi:hypothetical protein
MARTESDREDLLREATALIERAELRLLDYGEPIVIGFRRDGSGSLYVGGEPVFQFNSRGRLRRAYWEGELIKAEAGQLVALTRQRTATAVELIRQELSPARAAEILAAGRSWLDRIANALATGQFEVTGQVPEDGTVLVRIRAWLEGLPRKLQVAPRPHVG